MNLQRHGRVEVIQSMRTGTFAGFTVLGSQYRDEDGDQHWYVAVLAEPDAAATTYHVRSGEIPDELKGDEREAVIQAIKLWDAQPLSRPD